MSYVLGQPSDKFNTGHCYKNTKEVFSQVVSGRNYSPEKHDCLHQDTCFAACVLDAQMLSQSRTAQAAQYMYCFVAIPSRIIICTPDRTG